MPTKIAKLTKQLTDWDGKSSEYLKHLYQSFCNSDDFTGQLITLVSHDEYHIAASWLLKHALEQNNPPSKKQISRLFQLLASFSHWQAQLHILQSLPYLPINKQDKTVVELFIRKCLISDNKFVRAWSYDGFYRLAQQYPEYQEECQQFIALAMQDEAASVKARIRNLLK